MSRFVLVTGDFAKTGGMDRANYALARHLADRGDALDLVAHRVDDDLAARSNVRFHRVPKPLNSYMFAAPLLDHAGRRRAWAGASAGARVVVNGGNCRWGDVNWVHYVHAAWGSAPSGGALRRLKSVVDRRRSLAEERAALRIARLVVANSERTRADLIEHLGVPPDRVHTQYYGIDPERFRPPTESERAEARASLGWADDPRPILAFVGALGDRRKGFDSLFDAWTRLAADSSWDARLIVVGHGAALPAWRSRAAESGPAAASIEFLGFRRDVPTILRAADGLASPTRYEAYGLNVQESLACGLPTLVTAGAGVAERYPPELSDLLLPDPDDAADLAARLRRWRDALGQPRPALASLSDRLRAYTWDHMAADLAALIERYPAS